MNSKRFGDYSCRAIFRHEGQSLIELLIAIAVVSLVLVGVVSLSGVSIRNESFSQNQSLASEYNRQALEWIRGYRDSGWAAFKSYSSVTGNNYCANALPPDWASSSCGTNFIAGTRFQRVLNLTDGIVQPNDSVVVTVVVSWTDTNGLHDVRSVTHLTNWK